MRLFRQLLDAFLAAVQKRVQVRAALAEDGCHQRAAVSVLIHFRQRQDDFAQRFLGGFYVALHIQRGHAQIIERPGKSLVRIPGQERVDVLYADAEAADVASALLQRVRPFLICLGRNAKLLAALVDRVAVLGRHVDGLFERVPDGFDRGGDTGGGQGCLQLFGHGAESAFKSAGLVFGILQPLLEILAVNRDLRHKVEKLHSVQIITSSVCPSGR